MTAVDSAARTLALPASIVGRAARGGVPATDVLAAARIGSSAPADELLLEATVAVLAVQQFFVQLFRDYPEAIVPVVVGGGGVLGYLCYRMAYLLEGSAGGTLSLISTITGSTVLAPSKAMFTSRYRPRSEVLYVLLAFLNVGVLAGLALVVQIGRPRYFGMVVVGVLTVVLVDAMIFRPFEHTGSALVARTTWLWAGVQDRRFAASALLASVGVVLTVGRGLVFFGLVAAFVASMTLRVCLLDRERGSLSSSLVLLAGGGATVIAAQVLTVPYYVRTQDTLYHTALARHIAEVGSLSVVAGTRYAELPVFHTLGAVYVQLSELAPRTVLGVAMALLFPVVVLAGYAFVRNVTGSRRAGFFGAALLIVNPEFISWGTQAHVQSLSFVFLAVFLVLLNKWGRDLRYTFTAGLLTLAWVMTHHLSVFMSAVLVSAWLLAGIAWALVANRELFELMKRPLQQVVLFVAAIATYWWTTGLIQVPVNWLTEHSPAASKGLPTEQFVIQTYTDPVELAAAAVPFLLNNVHYAFFLALSAYGLWSIVRSDETLPRHTLPKLVVGFLAAAPLYMPNPIWMVARGMAVLNRWGIMTLLFLLPMVALGVKRLAAGAGHSRTVFAVSMIVFCAAFTSVGAGFTDPSLSDAVGSEKGARKYFSNGDLHASEHVLRHTEQEQIYASHALSGYLRFEEWTGQASQPPERFGRISVEGDRLVAQPGLTVVEYGSLQRSQIKLPVAPEQSDVYEQEVTVLSPVSSDEVSFRPDRHNVVYHNSEAMILFESDSGDGTGTSSSAGDANG